MTAVTADESKNYFEFVSGQLKPISAGPWPDILWHYTNGYAAIQIVKKKYIWSTQIGCVNDHMELRYAVSQLRYALSAYKNSHALTPNEMHLYEEAHSRLSDESRDSYWFITSFSEAPDDLSQWRAYGEGEGGYALGFNTRELHDRGLPDQTFLARVSYDAALHSQIATNVAEATFKYFNQGLSVKGRDLLTWTNQFLDTWGNMIAFIGPTIKHPSFSSEKEWRLVRGFRSTDLAKLEFIQKKTLMSRHLPLTFPIAGTTDANLPITDCIVGPSRNNRVSQVSIQTMLGANGLGSAKVMLSTVPYQSA